MSRTDPLMSTGTRKRSSGGLQEGNASTEKRRWVDHVDYLSLLPPELKYCITQYLDAEEVRICRLVSSVWKNMMDNLYAHDVVLDPRNGFRGDLDISMKTCNIVALGKMNCRPLFVKYATVMPRKVIIYREINKWNLYDLNNNWNNVTVLDLGWRAMASNSMFTMVKSSRRSKQFLPHLSSLKIGVPHFNNLTSRTTPNTKLNGGFIFSQNFSNLRDLSIDFVYNPLVTDLFPVILTFIRAHSGSIMNLNIRMLLLTYSSYPPANNHPANNSTILLFEPQIPISAFDDVVETLINSIQYKFTPTVDRHNQEVEEWRNFLADENPNGTLNLSRIITEKLMNYPLQIIDFYGGMISETSLYITELQLSSLTLFRSPLITPLDAEIFGSMPNLQRLILKRSPILFHTAFHPDNQNPIEIINLAKLPSSLKHLTIKGFSGESKDLKKMITTLENLRSLDFTKDTISIITNFVTGFDLLGLEKLFRHPQLKEATVNMACHVRPSFCADFYRRLISSCNWTIVHFSSGITGLVFLQSKISIFKA